ncbi:MAG TPA: TRAP transporter substrate-binding protein DctP [Kofleriaceae bacterium]|nr:TRAP transporter substrate-binding protein DctP [Kofleriaceae bacterium]
MALGVCAASPAHAQSAPTELRMATLAPNGSTWSLNFAKAGSAINAKTAGRVTLKWYEGGSQGDEKDYVRKIGLGQLDGAAITSTGLSMIDESIRVLELPDLFDSVDEMNFVVGKMWPSFQRAFAAKGYILADRGEVGWFYLMSKQKLGSLADLGKDKPWLWTDDKIAQAMYARLGVSGVPLGVPEVDAALTSSRLDLIYSSPLAAVALQWSTKVSYRSDLAMYYGVGAIVISKKVFDALSPADQRIVTNLLQKYGKEIRTDVRKNNLDADKTMIRAGVKVTPADASTRSAWDAAAQQVWTDLAGKVYTQAQLDEVLKYRAAYRAKH